MPKTLRLVTYLPVVNRLNDENVWPNVGNIWPDFHQKADNTSFIPSIEHTKPTLTVIAKLSILHGFWKIDW